MNGYLDFLRAQVPAPVLVLGLGNTLLTDDGVGPALVEQLSGGTDQWNGQVEFVDGGT
jgi:hydrogenase maturation protease